MSVPGPRPVPLSRVADPAYRRLPQDVRKIQVMRATAFITKSLGCLVLCLACQAADNRDKPTIWMPTLQSSQVYDWAQTHGGDKTFNNYEREGKTLTESYVPSLKMRVGDAEFVEPPSAEATIQSIRRKPNFCKAIYTTTFRTSSPCTISSSNTKVKETPP